MLKVHFWNVHQDSIERVALFEYEEGRMTSRRFKDIIRTLFQASCEGGIDAKSLAAVVSDGVNILFAVSCISDNRVLDPSAIDAYLTIHPHGGPDRSAYRTMNIAS